MSHAAPHAPSYTPPPPPPPPQLPHTSSSMSQVLSNAYAFASGNFGSTGSSTPAALASSAVPPPPPTNNDNPSPSRVCFHEKTRTEFQSLKECIESFQDYASSVDFVQKMGDYGFVNAVFSPNKHLQNETCPALEKFQKGFEFDLHHSTSDGGVVQQSQKSRTEATIGLVFHGTRDGNIEDILQNGLDVKLRRGQAYGAGEYFSTEPGVSISYCRGGLKMLVFTVVLPDKHATPNCPHNYAVIENNNHQLPIGTVSFSSVSKFVVSRSLAARNHLKWLENKLEIQQRMTKDNEVKLKILKFIFKGQDGFEAASTLYKKHCDVEMVRELTNQVNYAMQPKKKEKENEKEKKKENEKEKEKEEEPNSLDATKFASFVSCIDQGKMGSGSLSYLSCREISHYYWKCPNVERTDRKCVVDFYFPFLPPPLTIEERDSIGTGSALCFEAAHNKMQQAKDDVEAARKKLRSSLGKMGATLSK